MTDGRDAPPEPDDAVVEGLVAHRRIGSARIAAVLVGLLIVGLIAAVAVMMNRPEATAPSPAIGKIVPELIGTTLDGEPFDIDQMRGQWVALNLFATWCVPCQIEHPELVAFDEEHRAIGDARVVSVVFGDSDEAVREFFDERGGEWPVLGEEHSSSIIVGLGATGVPETFIVAPNGLIVARILGGVTQQLLNDVIARSQS